MSMIEKIQQDKRNAELARQMEQQQVVSANAKARQEGYTEGMQRGTQDFQRELENTLQAKVAEPSYYDQLAGLAGTFGKGVKTAAGNVSNYINDMFDKRVADDHTKKYADVVENQDIEKALDNSDHWHNFSANRLGDIKNDYDKYIEAGMTPEKARENLLNTGYKSDAISLMLDY